MTLLIITLIIGISLTIIIILFFLRYLNFINRYKLRKKKKETEKSLDKALKKYVVKEKKDVMKQKLGIISEIITQTEAHIDQTVKKKVKIAKTQLKVKEREVDFREKANMEYNAFISHFKSAMPRTETERIQDMKELKSAISMLESFDELSYEAQPIVFDAPVGMFYEKMSRRFLSFIKENELNKFDFIPIDTIKYHAFMNIKNINDKDILPILNAMKDTKLLNDIIEINPTFHIIVFKNNEELEFSLAEKVLLTFAYDEELLSNQRLMELTEWKEEYAKKIIEKLIEKGIVSIQENYIIVENFGSIEQRRTWRKVIHDKIQQEKEIQEAKRKKQLEEVEILKERLAEVEEIEIIKELKNEEIAGETLNKIHFKEKPSVKKLLLPDETIKLEFHKIKQKETQEIKDKDDLIGAMEALDEFMPAESIEKYDIDKEIIEDENINLEDLIPEKILSYHEKFSLINGGLSQFEKIKRFIVQEIGEVPEDLIRSTLFQLKELKMIHDSYRIGNYEFFLFNELLLAEDEKAFIQFAFDKNPMPKENFSDGLDWDEERVLKTMRALQEKKVLRIEKNKIIIPGIIQKK
jgi:hypothetical protein